VDLKGCRFRNREQQKLVTSLFCKWIFYGNRAGRNKFDSALARVVTLIFEFPPRLFATVVTSTFRTPRRHETMKNRPTTTSRIEMSPPRGDTNWTKTITIQFLMDTVDGNDAINYRLCRPKIRGGEGPKGRRPPGASRPCSSCIFNLRSKPEITSAPSRVLADFANKLEIVLSFRTTHITSRWCRDSLLDANSAGDVALLLKHRAAMLVRA
jgi:hypothetical protein